METIHQADLQKRIKLCELEAFTPEQLKLYAEENLNIIEKSEGSKADIQKAVADELRSFIPFKVIGQDQEGHVTENIMMIRPAQIAWDEPTDDIQKSLSGTYLNTDLNRKLKRVGQRYGEQIVNE